MEDPTKGYIPPTYPLQVAYPPQEPDYPQPTYPPQPPAYDPNYPPQTGAAAPPPYESGPQPLAPQTAQQTNVAVIQTQPRQAATINNRTRFGKNDKGLVYAII